MQQIQTFHIDGFRGLRDVALEDIGGVNLIVGGNNSGKTSVLEALAVYSSPLDIGEWGTVARTREVRGLFPGDAGLSAVDAMLWLFPHEAGFDQNRDAMEIRISATGSTKIRRLSALSTPIRGIPPEPRFNVRKGVEPEITEQEGWHLSIDADFSPETVEDGHFGGLMVRIDNAPGHQHVKLELDVWSGIGTRYTRPPRRVGVPCRMLSPYSHRNQPMQMRQLSRIVSSGQKSDLLELLHGIDGNLADLEIITDNGGRPLITALFNDGRRVPVTVLGDGFRRALAIAIAINDVKGGMLLIDEIETALHVSALDDLFPWLVKTAEMLNVQVFATTHSLEAIQAITVAATSVAGNCLTAYHLPDQSQKNGQIRRYSSGMLQRLVRDRGLDIR